jgi:predicted O-methyltransferase YrrM
MTDPPRAVNPETEPMIALDLAAPGLRRPGVISACVPSRGRAAKLAASIGSLRCRAARPELLEILVAHDPDDPETAAAARDLGADVVLAAPQRYGYARSARYWAALLNRASGQWLLPTWSDDAQMMTSGWDDLLRGCPAGSVAYTEGNYPGLTCFPAVHADALGAAGRLAPLPALDTWFEDAGRAAGVLVMTAAYVYQDRPDLTGCPPDRTHAEGGGAWRAAHNGGAQAFYAEPYTRWRAEDAAAMRRHRQLEEGYAARLAAWSDIQEQMPLLRAAARRYARPVIAELGTRTGESTSALLAGASASGGHVWSVDPGPSTAEWAGSPLWSFLGASDMSSEAAAWLPAGLDILFIDTSHLYDHTLAELRRYVPRVRPGGMVICHDTELTIGQMADYGEPGASDAARAGSPRCPVAAALGQFCSETGLAWEAQGDRPAPAPGKPFFGMGTITIPEGWRCG